MKQVVLCITCDTKFECTLDNVIDKPRKKGEDGYSYKCPNGHIKNYPFTEKSFVKHTVDEAIDIVKCLQEGKNNKYLISDVDLKIGDFKKCEECGNITDVVIYNGLMDYDANCSTECGCSRECRDTRWWRSDCKDDKCGFHGELDIPKLEREQDDYEARDKILNEIFEKCPPVNDSVIELDKIAFLFGETKKMKDSVGNGSTVDIRSYVFGRFITYCAKHDLIR